MSADFYYYKSYGHEKLLIDLTLLTPDEVAFAQKHLTVFDSQTLFDFAQSFRFSLSQLANKHFQRALYLLNKSIRTPKVHLGFPQLFFTNDNSDIAALNFLLIKPSTHIHVFTNLPPKREIDKIIAEVKYYMNYSKYFQLFFWYNEEKESQTHSDTNTSTKSKRSSKQKSASRRAGAKPRSKTKSPKRKSKTKSKAKSPKRKSKPKSKTKSKTKVKSKSKAKSPKRTSPKRKSSSKQKSASRRAGAEPRSKAKSPKRKSPKRKSKTRSKAKSRN